MEKLKMHTPDLAQDNIVRIRELFPSCVTETKDDQGNLKLAVNFDQLKQELSGQIVEGPQDRYHLNWPGKREALLTANAPIAKTLRPARDESVDFDTTKNLFIEGDNLDALKLLKETYLGKVKMIYIDPPYNTGNDFVYDDDFAIDKEEYESLSGIKDSEGNKTFDEEKWKKNTSSNGRFHSDWLSMMYSRLKLARSFLKDDGLIFISINDVEINNLRKIGDEIFGEDNFVASLIWKSRQIIDSRPQNNVSNDHEYIVIYSKTKEGKVRGKEIDQDKYTNPDKDERGPWMSNSILGLANKSQRPNLHYNITDPKTDISYPCPPDSGWRYSKETMAQKIQEARIVFPAKPAGRPREKKFSSELNKDFTGFSSMLSLKVGYTLNGTREVRELFQDNLFPFPKPVSLIKELLIQGISTDDDAIILDFFAGSATTAEATMRLSKQDGKNLRYITVQIPEKTEENSNAYNAGYKNLADLSKERIRRAGKKILEDDGHEKWNKDIGFRVLKIDSSNIADIYYTPDALDQKGLLDAIDNIKPGRDNPEDLLFQILLDWGVDLTLPISKETIQSKTVFFVNHDPYDLIACFHDGVTEDLVKELAGYKPLRVVFRDNGFVSDAVKINVDQIFKQLSPTTDVKSI
jgi:adenine-specific DNA-methyltransferase